MDDAAPLTILRRVSFDLTGLPPSSAEVKAFLADHSPAAYENFGDSYTRFVAGDGERSVKMYYSRLTLKDNGVVEWRPFNGNGNEYGDVWTTDADAIAAACP